MRIRLAGDRSKYGAMKQTVDGITFDSKKEATRYGELKLLQRASEIGGLRWQVEFPLTVLATDGELVGIGCYVADFVYTERGRVDLTIEDTKGFRTPLYRWKRKHVEVQYGITIKET